MSSRDLSQQSGSPLDGGSSTAPRTLREWKVRLVWEPRDLWLGAYRDPANRRLYLCILPCLPIVIERPA